MTKVAIVGATGPTGIHLAIELRKRDSAVRVIARGMDKLARLFTEATVEKWPADILDVDATLRAVDGCDLVYDCVGLPGDQMHLHPITARNIASALQHTKARCVQVSSYWAYYPQVRTEMSERHPRSGGPPWVRYRREAEDILCQAGAAILHLPDFYAPQVHVSTLQNALNEATHASGLFFANEWNFPTFAAHKSGLRATVPTLCSPRRTEGKNSGTVHPRSDNPTDAVQENGTYGGRRQSRWLRTADGFAI